MRYQRLRARLQLLPMLAEEFNEKYGRRIALDESVPDHSTISRTRRLMDVETHQAVFQWVLAVLAEKKLLKGTTIGVDATTLEANAALRSIVRRDTGERYEEFLTRQLESFEYASAEEL